MSTSTSTTTSTTTQSIRKRRTGGHRKRQAISEVGRLLADPSDYIATLAMERIINGNFTDTERQQFLRDNQDCEDMLMRKRIQQLNGALKMQSLQDELVRAVNKPHKFGVIKCLILLDRMYNPKSSDEYLIQLMRDLYAGFKPNRALSTAKNLQNYIEETGIVSAPLPWNNVGFFLIGDILENHIGIPHIITALVAAIAQARSIDCSISMYDGRLGVYFPNGDWLCPMPTWEIKSGMQANKMHICDTVSVMRVILGLATASSLMMWNPCDARIFGEILARIDCLDINKTTYPFGDTFQPPKK